MINKTAAKITSGIPVLKFPSVNRRCIFTLIVTIVITIEVHWIHINGYRYTSRLHAILHTSFTYKKFMHFGFVAFSMYGMYVYSTRKLGRNGCKLHLTMIVFHSIEGKQINGGYYSLVSQNKLRNAWTMIMVLR